jgi:hypothetical protein
MGMRKGVLALVVGAVVVGAQEEEKVTLRLVKVPGKGQLQVRLEGEARFADGTLLRLGLCRLEERLYSGRLQMEERASGGVRVVVRDRKFAYEGPLEGPGVYRAVVEEVGEEGQGYPGGGTGSQWKFDFWAWGEDWVSQWSPGLGELDELAGETLGLFDGVSAAMAAPESWEESAAELNRQAEVVLGKLHRSSGARDVYTMAARLIARALGLLQTVVWASIRTNEGEVETDLKKRAEPRMRRGLEGISLDRVRKEVESARELAGREFALWVLKEVRRAGLHAALLGAIQEREGHPGLAPFVERLRGAQGDLEGLEGEIRAVPGAGEEEKP